VRRNVLFTVVGFVTAVVLLGGTALATTANFVLGSTTANKPDALTAATAQNKDGHGGLNGPMIQLTNSSTGSSASPLGLTVGSGRPPLSTNSTTRVAHLNADLLDGVDSSGLVQGGRQLVTKRLAVPAGTSGFLDYTGTPAFRIYDDCPADPSTNGDIQLWNERTTTAYMYAVIHDGTVNQDTGGKGYAVANLHDGPAGNMTTFDASWTDGHTATVWVTSYHGSNGCFAYVMAAVK
jgi:hypothetical protein